ncbi:MAG: hypothetical protein HND47_03685 [Chloroflexi bacterium]|nr:hypothetical protein [Chloroflexota bacterium]
MLETMPVINSLGMILIPILAGFYFARKFKLSWKFFPAGRLNPLDGAEQTSGPMGGGKIKQNKCSVSR